MNNGNNFDIIVIGGGHAGIEAALAGARMGLKTLMITINLDTIGLMPCNPSIGGPGKGHLVREVDALGGEMARNIDRTFIHNRMLNTSKGPAVQALRAQADKKLYQFSMKHTLENQENISIKQATVKRIAFNVDDSDLAGSKEKEWDLSVVGVETDTGEVIFSKAIVVTTGTFLNGKVHIGDLSYSAGRLGEFASMDLTDSLRLAGFQVGRLKTGTVPRVNSNQIDFSKCIEQEPSADPLMFSYRSERRFHNRQVSCWTTYTNEKTHDVLRRNFGRSPLFGGKITGVGPRYCPSIEDKVRRFTERLKHPVFIEPEGINTNEIYLQGLSTSLPIDVQMDMIKTIDGLEHVDIMRPGYAIEYDYINPLQLFPSLMSKLVRGLFFAGQINGTSGYEEAAAQGLVAGINSAAFVKVQDPLILNRTNSYTGVLIDDLVTKGTSEPYRIFTARVEHRLSIRFDNADDRLAEIGFRYGLLGKEDFELIQDRGIRRKSIMEELKSFHVKPSTPFDSLKPYAGKSYYDALKSPEITIDCFSDIVRLDELEDIEKQRICIEIKYDGYIKKQDIRLAELKKMEDQKIPDGFDFLSVQGMSSESRHKLNEFRPISLGQASRISGVSPSDIIVLIYNLKQILRSQPI